jgi:tRNA pseudouridine38-40 synthase
MITGAGSGIRGQNLAMPVCRIAAGIEYFGHDFKGWQRQAVDATIQGAVEHALSRVADADVTVTCAGRTDTGVHARQQVIHFDTPARRPEQAWVLGANSHLPAGISIVWARAVSEGFHARYSALQRSYRYLILNRRARPGLLTGRVAWECRPLEERRMRAAAQFLTGEHDFSAFRSAECQARNPVRRITRLDVARNGLMLAIDVDANAFLHHMVRNIAGVLMMIGLGRQPASWAGAVLESRDRKLGGVTAPPEGLYLAGVKYPPEFGIPEPEPVFWPDSGGIDA